MKIDPKIYGLPSRIQLVELGENHLGIRKVIKSRIIRNDAEKIVAISKEITKSTPEYKISLVCNRNICSKSLKLLAEEGIGIRYIN